MTVYQCNSPFCNCEYSENNGSCSCCKKQEKNCCDCCCCCCHRHQSNNCGCNDRVCYPVAVESFDCCSCWSRC